MKRHNPSRNGHGTSKHAPLARRSPSPLPHHSVLDVVRVADAIKEHNAGKPYDRLLLADALGYSPSSSGYRLLLRSGAAYKLTQGSEKASHIALAEPLGVKLTSPVEPSERETAIVQAALAPELARKVYQHYDGNKWPSGELLQNALVRQFSVDSEWAQECAHRLEENAKAAGFLQTISGSVYLRLDPSNRPQSAAASSAVSSVSIQEDAGADRESTAGLSSSPPSATPPPAPRLSRMFIGHGRNRAPLEQLKAVLTELKIPYSVAVDEPNRGLPISAKVAEVMDQCTAACLIFTKDVRYFDEKGGEVWLPADNVSHELGAASKLYGHKIIVFKERGIELPTNFRDIGYIEFDHDDLKSKSLELLRELLSFGMLRFT